MRKQVKSRKRRIVYVAAALVLAGVFFTGCVTTGKSAPKSVSGTGSAVSKASGSALPKWAVSYPVDPQAFIGIGSSNTGDKGSDMEQARLRALADLSASISTQIESELVIESQDDSQGNRYEKMTEKIRENVKQNLQGAEPVDTFYSPQEGYWVYYRFTKAKLAEMKEELKRRILSMVEPVFTGDTSLAERFMMLWNGWKLIQDSPFVGTVKAELNGRSGSLVDLLEQNITQLSGTLVLKADPREIKTQQGGAVSVSLILTSPLSKNIGQFELVMLDSNTKEEIARAVTEQDGSYSGKLDITAFKPGKTLFDWEIDYKPLGLDPKLVRVFSPVTEQYIDIQKTPLGLQVIVGNGEEIPGLRDSVISVFSQKLYAQITGGFDPKKTNLIFTVYFTDFPKNDFGLFFTNARAVLNFKRGEKSLFSFETGEFKEGGLTPDQARERAKNKLFSSIETDQSLFDKMNKALASSKTN